MSRESAEFAEALEALIDRVHREQRTLFRDWKVTPLQFFVLKLLAKDPEAHMSTVAELLGVRPQTVTPIVDSLERAGWLRRVRSTKDRRESLLKLTPRGHRLLDSVRAAFFAEFDRALDRASRSSLRAAIEALELAANGFEGPASDPTPPLAPAVVTIRPARRPTLNT